MKKEDIQPIWRCLATQAELQKDSGLIVMAFIAKDLLDNNDQCQKQVQKRI